MKVASAKMRHADRLRAAAETLLESGNGDKVFPYALDKVAQLLPQDLLHDLQVHHVELEMQNESLRETTVCLEESRDRYLDLYEFAPVAYLTLDGGGFITEINLAGSELIGRERKRLLHRPFTTLVVGHDQARWLRHFRAEQRGRCQGSIELALHRGDDAEWHAQLDFTRLSVQPGGGANVPMQQRHWACGSR